jgi:hypothetical protein
VRRTERTAFDAKSNQTAEAMIGSCSRVVAGIASEPISITLLGALPWVISSAIEVAKKPMARIPIKSSIATRALIDKKMKNLVLSFGFINLRERLTTFNTGSSLLC